MSRMFLNLFALAAYAGLFRGGNGETVCDDTSECTSQTINDDDVSCYGYKSCQSSTLTGTNSGHMKCYGPESCSFATISGDADGTAVECDGYKSCGPFTSIDSTNSTHCNARSSCRLMIVSSTNVLYADGPNALGYALITGTPMIHVHGYQGLALATIGSRDVDYLEIDAQGEYGLEGTNLYCFNGSECVVKCAPGSSCSGLNFYCADGATCHLGCNKDCGDCPIVQGSPMELSEEFEVATALKNNQLDLIMKKYRKSEALKAFDEFDEGSLPNDISDDSINGMMNVDTEGMFQSIYGEYGGEYIFYAAVWATVTVLFIGVYQICKWIREYCNKVNNSNLLNKHNKGCDYQSISLTNL